jgi:hypothetical protein
MKMVFSFKATSEHQPVAVTIHRWPISHGSMAVGTTIIMRPVNLYPAVCRMLNHRAKGIGSNPPSIEGVTYLGGTEHRYAA